MIALPTYRNPFADGKQVKVLEQRYVQEDEAKSRYPDRVALAAGRAILNHDNLRENLQKIFRWKLQSFLKRFNWVIEFPGKEISNSQIQAAMDAARNADGDEPRTIIPALRALDDLPYVGIPVASAFLTAIHPRQFTVIDRQAYKALGAVFPNCPSPNEYMIYLDFCREQAARLGVSLREFDRALWQQGSESSRLPKHRESCMVP